MRKSALISFLPLILPLANAISLADFQQLTVDVSTACVNAYDSDIPSCTVDDFTSGCSSGCILGLSEIAEVVLTHCGGTVVGSKTLLGRIFSGSIVTSLCPNNNRPAISASEQTTTAAPATTVTSSTSAPVSSTLITTTSAAVVSSSSTSSLSSVASLSTSISSSTSSTAARSSTSTTPVVSSSTTVIGVSSTTASSSTSSSAAAQTSSTSNGRSGLSVPQQQIAAVHNSGGGSPFDIIGYSAAPRLAQREMIAIAVGPALLVAGWLLR